MGSVRRGVAAGMRRRKPSIERERKGAADSGKRGRKERSPGSSDNRRVDKGKVKKKRNSSRGKKVKEDHTPREGKIDLLLWRPFREDRGRIRANLQGGYKEVTGGMENREDSRTKHQKSMS